jgi:hypothetical protein
MNKIEEATQIITSLGYPAAQQNDRSALCLLALLNLGPNDAWSQAGNPLIGITPILSFAREQYGVEYAPNSRETFRRQTMHQFMEGGLSLYNPDKPDRPVNSPKAVYQIEPAALELIRQFGSSTWDRALIMYMAARPGLAERYAMRREQRKIPVIVEEGQTLYISPGKHSQLIKDIIEDFAPRFAPGSQLIYAGDTGEKVGFFNAPALADLGVEVDKHGKMPDVVLHYLERDWLLLVESVTSHGPVDPKRHGELSELFKSASVGLVYVTAFPNRRLMARYLTEIAWETEVWCAESPSHLIHFNGVRFLGPY